MPDYRLLQEHRINKVMQPVGHLVDLPAQTGDWLAEQGIMERVDEPVTPAVRQAAPAAPVFAPAAPRWSCCGQRPK